VTWAALSSSQQHTPELLPCAGQSNDGIFKQAAAGRVTCKVDAIKEVQEDALVLATGERVPADVLVCAFGLKYQAEPVFLKELGIGAYH